MLPDEQLIQFGCFWRWLGIFLTQTETIQQQIIENNEPRIPIDN